MPPVPILLSEKRRKNEEPEKKSEHNTDGKGNQGDQTGAIPVIHVIFQKEVEEEELAAEIADMYLHGRAFYYTGKHATDTREEDTVYVRHKDVQWNKLKTFMYNHLIFKRYEHH